MPDSVALPSVPSTRSGLQRAMLAAVTATIALSAFLLFLVQPLLAKAILPWFGGTAAVWTVCLLFFQAMLLAGYAYAHWIGHRPRRQQLVTHGLVLAASLLFLPIIPAQHWKPEASSDPTGAILWLLIATVGLPYFALAATAPLTQQWLSQRGQGVMSGPAVFRLYALSNAGSLLGLLAYPFLIEPHLAIATQAHLWSAAFAVFACACGYCAWQAAGDAAPAVPAATTPVAAPAARRIASWVGAAALGSALLLAVTNHMTQNIASIPFLWVVPLSVYLLTFIFAFEGRGGQGWYVRRAWLAPCMFAVAAMAWGLYAHNLVLSPYVALPLFTAGLFLGCMLCHGELAATKPHPRYLTQFYLSIAAGGAVGGVTVGLVAPHVFDSYWETPLACVLLGALGVIAARRAAPLTSWRRWLVSLALGLILAVLALLATQALPGSLGERAAAALPPLSDLQQLLALGLFAAALVAFQVLRLPFATSVTALAVALGCGWSYHDLLTERTDLMVRDFYGTLRVRQRNTDDGPMRTLVHGVILHGAQFVDAAKERMPTTYYGPSSGIGRAIVGMRHGTTPQRVGSIGLGTGTLAAYGRQGDRYRIYEIDPLVEKVATERFTFVQQSRAEVTIVLGDARLSLERELARGQFRDPAQRFDVLSVDAFSSDSIPVHLLTREAFQVYAQAIKDDGVIAFHTSNRFLDLPPVVAAIANEAGYRTVVIDDDPDDTDAYSVSQWVLVTRNADFLAIPDIGPSGSPVRVIRGLSMWTDDFNNLLQIVR